MEATSAHDCTYKQLYGAAVPNRQYLAVHSPSTAVLVPTIFFWSYCYTLSSLSSPLSLPLSPLSLPRLRIPEYQWDYRWMDYPGDPRAVRHPHDCSLLTYCGHKVLQTLIRCYFSPAHSTAQRFIYSGSHDGCVYIYDVVRD